MPVPGWRPTDVGGTDDEIFQRMDTDDARGAGDRACSQCAWSGAWNGWSRLRRAPRVRRTSRIPRALRVRARLSLLRILRLLPARVRGSGSRPPVLLPQLWGVLPERGELPGGVGTGPGLVSHE